MVKRTKPTKYHCRDCMYHYGDYEKDYKGDNFMCLCKLSPWSKMLDMNQCKLFKLKTKNNEKRNNRQ